MIWRTKTRISDQQFFIENRVSPASFLCCGWFHHLNAGVRRCLLLTARQQCWIAQQTLICAALPKLTLVDSPTMQVGTAMNAGPFGRIEIPKRVAEADPLDFEAKCHLLHRDCQMSSSTTVLSQNVADQVFDTRRISNVLRDCLTRTTTHAARHPS
jgi:hypothetical protein